MPLSQLEDSKDVRIAIIDAQLAELHLHYDRVSAMLNEIEDKRRILGARRTYIEGNKTNIHLLPNELIIELFRLVVDTVLPQKVGVRIDTTPIWLSHVCRRWRELAIGVSYLWRRIILHRVDVSHRALTRRSSVVYFNRLKGHPAEVYFSDPAKGTQSAVGTHLVARASSNSISADVLHGPTFSHVLFAFSSIALLNIRATGAMIFETSQFLFQHNSTTFCGLEQLSLSLVDCSPSEVINLHLALSKLKNTHHPLDETTRFPLLGSIYLISVPITAIPSCRFPLLSILAVDFTGTKFEHSSYFPLDFFNVACLSCMLRCAPSVEMLSLINAGPIFDIRLNRDINPDGFWCGDTAWQTLPTQLVPVQLNALHDLEYAGAEPNGLYYFLSFFPAPHLQTVDVSIVEINSFGFPAAGPHTIPSDTLPANGEDTLTYIPLLHLHTLRVEVTSSESLRGSFLRLVFPALKTLSLINTNLCPRIMFLNPDRTDADHPQRIEQALPPLPRPESIFRDPRMPRLRSLSITAFTLDPEHAQTLLVYTPELRRLSCEIMINAAVLLTQLRRDYVCPLLSTLEFWGCDDLPASAIRDAIHPRRTATFRNPAAHAGNRAIKPLKRGKVAIQVPGPYFPRSGRVTRIEKLSVTGCKLISEDSLRLIKSWEVDVEWSPGAAAESPVWYAKSSVF